MVLSAVGTETTFALWRFRKQRNEKTSARSLKLKGERNLLRKVTEMSYSHSAPVQKGSEGPAGGMGEKMALAGVGNLVVLGLSSHPLKLEKATENLFPLLPYLQR